MKQPEKKTPLIERNVFDAENDILEEIIEDATPLERDVLGAKDSKGNAIKVGKGFRANELSEADLKEREEQPVKEEQLEDNWSQKEEQHYLKTRLGQATIIALSLLIIAGIWAFLNLRKEDPIIKQREQKIAQQILEAEKAVDIKAKQEANIKLCVKNYLEASNKEDRSAWCRDPEATLLKMAKHQSRGNKFKKYHYTGELEFNETYLDTKPIVVVSAQCLLDPKETEQKIELIHLMLEPQIDNTYKVDWETAATYQPNDWDQFILSKSTEPQNFRIDIIDKNNTGPYLYPFNDDKKYQAYRVNIRDKPDTFLIAYAKAGSTVDLKLKENLQIDSNENKRSESQSMAPMILQLRYPSNPQSSHCVEITNIISSTWFQP